MKKHQTQKRKNTSQSKANKGRRSRNLDWIIIILVVLIVGVGIGMATAERHRQQKNDRTLAWPLEKVLASPKNTKEFIEARLAYLADRIPDDMTHPSFAPVSISRMFRSLLKSGEMDLALIDIHKGQKLAKSGKYRLIFIGDIHYNPLFDLQSQRSVDRQKWIITTLRENPNTLVFVEGATGTLTWESEFRREQAACRAKNIPGPQTIEQYRTVMLANSRVWWNYFLDDRNVTLYGIDRKEICECLMVMGSLHLSSSLQAIWQDTFELLAKTYREQAILGWCIREMHDRQITEATIVLGEGHIEGFSKLSKEWGVELQIIKPPK